MADSVFRHVRGALAIVKPRPARAGACKKDVVYALRRIGAQERRPTLKQLRQVEDQLKKVRQALSKLPADYHYYLRLPQLLREIDRVRPEVVKVGRFNLRVKSGAGRDRAVEVRQKQVAAREAFDLLLYWGEQAPTTTKGAAYARLTAALFEFATGKNGSVTRACERVIKEAKKHGYDPSRMAQYHQFMARTRVVPTTRKK